MGKKSKRRNQTKNVNKKANHATWIPDWKRVDNRTGETLERLSDKPQNELVDRIRNAYTAPPPAQGKAKPDNVVDMDDHRAAMRQAGRDKEAAEQEALDSAKKGTTIAGANQRNRESEAAKQQRVFNEVSWVQTMSATAKAGKLTCQRDKENMLSFDYCKRKGKLTGFFREQCMRRQQNSLLFLTGKLGHESIFLDDDAIDYIQHEQLVNGLRNKFASEGESAQPYSPIEEGSGGYMPEVPLTPSGRPISEFLEGGKYPPKKRNVVRTTSAANDTTHVPSLLTITQSFIRNVPTEHWPSAVAKHVDYINGECVIDTISLDTLTLAEEHGLMRQITSAMLDYQASEIPKVWDQVEEHRLHSWHLSRTVDDLEYELEISNAQSENNKTRKEQEQEQKNRQPSTISALQKHERQLTEQLRDTVFERCRLQKQVADEQHSLIRLSRRAKAVAHAKRSNDVFGDHGYVAGKYAKVYDSWLFSQWSERHRRKYNPDHDNSVLESADLNTVQDKLDKRRKRAEVLAEKRKRAVERRRLRNQRRKERRQAQREHAEWVRDNTIGGKLVYTAGKTYNSLVGVMNIELNPVLRKKHKQRREEKRRNKEEKRRQSELKAHKEAARKAFNIAH